YVDHLRTPEEFELVFSEMLGELNGSHLGITMATSSYDTPGPNTGHLGLEFSDGTMALPWDNAEAHPAAGVLVVTHITEHGPADQHGVDIKLGDTLLSIDGTAVETGMRWYDQLQ